MSTICADLSPFYLARARSNMAYWKRQRAPALNLGGMDGTGQSGPSVVCCLSVAVGCCLLWSVPVAL
jgi:hypothetical protein